MRLRFPRPALTGGVVAVLFGTALSAAAQTPSPFETYRRYRDEPVGDWRKANDQVREIGGWRAYAREATGSPARAADAPGTPASAPSPAASAASAPGPAPAPGGHKQ